jgi:hypothetical protein
MRKDDLANGQENYCIKPPLATKGVFFVWRVRGASRRITKHDVSTQGPVGVGGSEPGGNPEYFNYGGLV